MSTGRIANAEVKAGLFLTFCLGLFVAMLFVYGKFTRSWRGRQELNVYFTHIANLRTEAVVQYNGLEVGRVGRIHIVRLDAETLASWPKMDEGDLENVPITDEEREALRGVPAAQVDAEIRKRILGRTAVKLTLEVLAEGDVKRYREDDRVRVSATLMGDSKVEIISGTGPSLPLDNSHPLLGISGDMYSDISKSLLQMKNVLASISELIGGDEDDAPLSKRLVNFDLLTERIDQWMAHVETQMPVVWDTAERRIEDGRQRVEAVRNALVSVQPELAGNLDRAEQSILDFRKKVSELAGAGRDKFKTLGASAQGRLTELGKEVRERKEEVPLQVRQTREWTERVAGKVDQIDRWMTDSDRSLTQSFESVRQTLEGLRQVADGLEEKSWYMARHPWAITQPPPDALGQALDAEWRKDLMARHFRELRGELDRALTQLKTKDPSDQARLNRVQQILQDMDGFLGAGRRAAETDVKVKSKK